MNSPTALLTITQLDVAIATVGILRGINLTLPSGAMTGLIGRNGAGKTTLMRSIMGILPAQRGTIQFENKNLLKSATHTRAAMGVGYMPEDRRLIPELTVEENIMIPAWATQLKDPTQRLQKIYALMPEVQAFAHRKALQLSGGQQKLVALARALMPGTKLLLLDEPFEGVAPVLARRLAEVIAGLKQEGLSILLSESDLRHSAHMLDQTFIIDRGEIVAREASAA